MTTVPAPGVDEIYRREILTIIQRKIDEHPRSAQAMLGPSEIGGCPTKVAFKMAYGGASDREGGWAAFKGTVLHKELDEIFKGTDRMMPDGSPRFLSDLKLPQISPLVNGGTLDLYDRLYETVLDWKLPGSWTVKAVRGGKISPGYAIQSQVYGLGLEAMGYPVRRVALAFLPMDGDDLHSAARGAIFRFWPYDRDYALGALDYVRRIDDMIDVAGIARVLEVLPKRSDFCSSCPAFRGSGDRRATCPGVAESARQSPARKLDASNPFAA